MFPGTGCVLDGSHMSGFDFAIAVIDLAVDAGFEINVQQYRQDLSDISSGNIAEDSEDLLEILQALDWTYDDALEYLNSGLPNGLHYTVDCNCLILEELDD
jgi:hypothetical protein